MNPVVVYAAGVCIFAAVLVMHNANAPEDDRYPIGGLVVLPLLWPLSLVVMIIQLVFRIGL